MGKVVRPTTVGRRDAPQPHLRGAAATPTRGQRITQQARKEQHEPRLPHEHDQSTDSQHTPGVEQQGRQALRDIDAGRVDTDAGRRGENVLGPPAPERAGPSQTDQMSKPSSGGAPKAR